MIRDKTILVLGAGTSVPFGFPTGEKLISNIKEDTSAPKLLKDKLMRSPLSSIDEFLYYNRTLLNSGKQQIWSHIFEAERNCLKNFFDPSKNTNYLWLSVLFRTMNSGCKSFLDFKKNKVTIITFNYDRLIEYGLEMMLKEVYGDNLQSDIRSYINSIVIHLHGSLASPDVVNFGDSNILQKTALEEYVDNIKIIFEATEGDTNFDISHKMLSEVEYIIIAGYSFNELNNERLFFDNSGKSRFPETAVISYLEYQNTLQSRPAKIARMFNRESAITLSYHKGTIRKPNASYIFTFNGEDIGDFFNGAAIWSE